MIFDSLLMMINVWFEESVLKDDFLLRFNNSNKLPKKIHN